MAFDFLQSSILAFIQGFTEFLPISSSAHLILPSILLNWDDQGLTFDVAVHLGSLVAVVLYFRRDIGKLLRAWLVSVFGQGSSPESRMAWLLILATIPAGLAGLLLNDWVENYARSALIIGLSSIAFGLLLYWADRYGQGNRADKLGIDELDWRHALVIGLAQALALIPGTSRSGITMTAALFCDLDRQDAAKFSFLLAIPIILASAALRGIDLLQQDALQINLPELAYAAFLSALVALLCIHYFLKLISRMGFLPFVIYRCLLGLIVLGVYLQL